jgi:hypothetical protein
VEFIGGEYVRFRSIQPFGGTILRRADACPDIFHYRSIEEPLEDVVEEHYQTVTRCAGCIAVEKQAVQIFDAFVQQQAEGLRQRVLDIDLDNLPHSLEDAFKEESK